MIKTFQKKMGTFFGAKAVIKPENLQSSRLGGIPEFFHPKSMLQICNYVVVMMDDIGIG